MDVHDCDLCPCSTPGETHCPCLHATAPEPREDVADRRDGREDDPRTLGIEHAFKRLDPEGYGWAAGDGPGLEQVVDALVAMGWRPNTAPDSTPTEREGVEFAKVLTKHRPDGWIQTSSKGYFIQCGCGARPYIGDPDQVWVIWGRHIAEALAPLIAERVRAAAVEALREAADDLYAGLGPDFVADSDGVYGDWLNARADRRAER